MRRLTSLIRGRVAVDLTGVRDAPRISVGLLGPQGHGAGGGQGAHQGELGVQGLGDREGGRPWRTQQFAPQGDTGHAGMRLEGIGELGGRRRGRWRPGRRRRPPVRRRRRRAPTRPHPRPSRRRAAAPGRSRWRCRGPHRECRCPARRGPPRPVPARGRALGCLRVRAAPAHSATRPPSRVSPRSLRPDGGYTCGKEPSVESIIDAGMSSVVEWRLGLGLAGMLSGV